MVLKISPASRSGLNTMCSNPDRHRTSLTGWILTISAFLALVVLFASLPLKQWRQHYIYVVRSSGILLLPTGLPDSKRVDLRHGGQKDIAGAKPRVSPSAQ